MDMEKKNVNSWGIVAHRTGESVLGASVRWLVDEKGNKMQYTSEEKAQIAAIRINGEIKSRNVYYTVKAICNIELQ